MADTYAVTGQRKTTDINAQGRLENVVEIDFTTKPTGIAGMITVGEADYTLDKVRPLLEAAAENIEAIQAH